MAAPVIAVLDNDLTTLSLLDTLLADDGYRLLLGRAKGETNAHALLRRVQPDLAIIGPCLTNRDDGLGFLKRVWGDFETTHIPVIVLSEQEIPPLEATLLRTLQCQVVRTSHVLRDLRGAIEMLLGPSPATRAGRTSAYVPPFNSPGVRDLTTVPLGSSGGRSA
jgi:CheY-like chemotaxis protein